MKILPRFLLLIVVLTVVACVSTTPDGKIIKEDKKEVVEDLKIIQSWSGDFPVAKLNVLPKGQERLPAGYIGDAATFKRVWEVFSPGTPVPEVNFEDHIVVFGRNTQFYNRTTIFKVTLNKGVAEILAMATMSANPIQDKVAISMAVVPKAGVQSIFTAGTNLPVE
ncbi:MAG TPA: hypothetical protein VIM41_11725 [Gammaproteobacteria bacterium]